MRTHEPYRQSPNERDGHRSGAPATRPDVAGLLRLNRLAGNAAVAGLVAGPAPVVQRVKLTNADEDQIKNLKKVNKATAKEARRRIKDFDKEAGAHWLSLVTFEPMSRVPDEDQKRIVAELYRRLGEGATLEALTEFRRGPGVPPPQPGKFKIPTTTAPQFALTPTQVTTGLKGLHSTVRNDTRPVPQQPPPPLPKSRWMELSVDTRQELTRMWDAWQRGETNAATFYDPFYKNSAVKAPMTKPSPDQYVADLKTQHLLGGVSEERAKSDKSGYPFDMGGNDTAKMPKSRIYLNPHPDHVADVHRLVKDHIRSVPGVTGAKVADHKTAMTARDVIVIYLSADPKHAGAEDAVLNVLRDYQTQNLNHFVDEVPRLTARKLPGVGIGDEPPQERLKALLSEELESMGPEEIEKVDWVLPDPQLPLFSFSQYRSTLIQRAIENSGGVGGDVKMFQQRVADYFDRAGIDLADPSVQKPPDKSALRPLGLIWPK